MSSRSRALPVLSLLGALCAASGCASRAQMLAQHQQALLSLRATARLVGDAWLSGAVSSTYARTALASTQQLLQKQRADWSRSPDQLADPAAAALSASEDNLARTLAQLWKAVHVADPVAARRDLASLGIPSPGGP